MVDSEIYEKDPLTGLLFKKRFVERVSSHIRENGCEGRCIISMDIKQFKLYNEIYGHEAGDLVLKKAGSYIRDMENAGDCIGGYFGSDDFMIFMPDEAAMVDRLYDAVSGYASVEGRNAGFVPAIGIFCMKDPGMPVDVACGNAQVASDAAKARYGRSICYFNNEMAVDIRKKQRVFNEMRRGIENGEFTFFLQPKCDIITGKIVSMEALVRWIHPVQGLLPPAEYIPILEQTGLIVDLDKYIWEKVCGEVRHWINEGLKIVPISVNISIVDIESMDVPAYLKGLTEKYGISTDMLAVEITETEFAKNGDVLKDVANRFHEMGFRILLDDFGSGYSSLNILKDINIDILKMDMKFLDIDADNLQKGRNILESVLNMAHAMDMKVIAEGVENKTHADILTALGCMYGQGYYFYRPMPIDQVKKLLADGNNIDDSGKYDSDVKARADAGPKMDGDSFARLYQRRQLEYMANYDALTKVYNRNRFENDIEKFDKKDFKSAECVYIDVIGLHEINNRLGHKAGDELLVYIADAVSRYFPSDDAYRMDGDEFAVICFDRQQSDIMDSIESIRGELKIKGYGIYAGIVAAEGSVDFQKLADMAEEEMRKDRAARKSPPRLSKI